MGKKCVFSTICYYIVIIKTNRGRVAILYTWGCLRIVRIMRVIRNIPMFCTGKIWADNREDVPIHANQLRFSGFFMAGLAKMR